MQQAKAYARAISDKPLYVEEAATAPGDKRIKNLEDKIETYINPEIEILEGEKTEEEEGCLSIYAIQGFKVKRCLKIKVTASDLRGNKLAITATDLPARIFQHEIDHLNGILYIDHLDPQSKRDLLAEINMAESE